MKSIDTFCHNAWAVWHHLFMMFHFVFSSSVHSQDRLRDSCWIYGVSAVAVLAVLAACFGNGRTWNGIRGIGYWKRETGIEPKEIQRFDSKSGWSKWPRRVDRGKIFLHGTCLSCLSCLKDSKSGDPSWKMLKTALAHLLCQAVSLRCGRCGLRFCVYIQPWNRLKGDMRAPLVRKQSEKYSERIQKEQRWIRFKSRKNTLRQTQVVFAFSGFRQQISIQSHLFPPDLFCMGHVSWARHVGRALFRCFVLFPHLDSNNWWSSPCHILSISLVNGHATGTDWLEIPTIYKAYIYKAYVGEYPHKIWPYMVQYLHFRILKFPLT